MTKKIVTYIHIILVYKSKEPIPQPVIIEKSMTQIIPTPKCLL